MKLEVLPVLILILIFTQKTYIIAVAKITFLMDNNRSLEVWLKNKLQRKT